MRGRASFVAAAAVLLLGATPAVAKDGTGGRTYGHSTQVWRQNGLPGTGHHRSGTGSGRRTVPLPTPARPHAARPVVPLPPVVQWVWDDKPDDEAWQACIQADTTCDGDTSTEGHFRTVSPTATPATGPAKRRGPTVGQVIRAGQREVASVTMPPPAATIEPRGGTVLVRMPTNFTVDATPYVRTVVLLGVPLTLTIYPESFTWDTGDDGVVGPTRDPGGLYPDATTTHTYTKPGSYPVTLTTTFYSTLTVPGYGTVVLPGRGNVAQTVGTLTATGAHDRVEAPSGP